MLSCVVTLAFNNQPVESSLSAAGSVSASYPYQNVFKRDLLDIANSVSEIQLIAMESYLDQRPTGHLWCRISIDYTSGLWDYEKIAIQHYVQSQLEPRWYIDIVEPNYLYWIPEEPPPPYPFVIGDLLVGFVHGSTIIKVPGYYPTIQEAINDADDGDTVFVENGIYYEHVVVNKTVSLIGENRESTIIDGNGTFVTIIHVTVNDAVITGFTIQNDASILCLEGGGVFVTNSNGTRVVDNIVTDTQYGVNLKNSTGNIIVGNTLTENDVGIQFLDGSSSNIIYHNNFFDNDLQTNSILGGPNIWDNGCEGNYWSDYNGTDVSNPLDGVGDTVVPHQGVDYCPLMSLYWIPSDINHDLKIDMKDVETAAKAFGSYADDLSWNPHADISGGLSVPDGKVDIRDVALIAKHFGEIHH